MVVLLFLLVFIVGSLFLFFHLFDEDDNDNSKPLF